MNPEDLMYIKRMTPYISEEILDELPYIPRQQALIFGSAVNMPMMFKVREADPRPKSDDNDITRHWYKNSDYVLELDFGDFNTVPEPVVLPQDSPAEEQPPDNEALIEDIPF